MLNIKEKISKEIKIKSISREDNIHSRYQYRKKNPQKVLIYNIPFIFTCDEDDKIKIFKNSSLIIEKDIIKEIVSAKKSKNINKNNFDLIYDAGKRGGAVLTPGFINTHAHIHMYLMRSAMMVDENDVIDKAIIDMAAWQKNEDEDSFAIASIGDVTEQQKNGITYTLTHGPSFPSVDITASLTGQNMVGAISAISNSRPENTPEMIEKLLLSRSNNSVRAAIAVHYLYKTKHRDLDKLRKIKEKFNAIFTCHLAESVLVAKKNLKKFGLTEVETLEKFGLLDEKTILSHVIHIQNSDIQNLILSKVGIVHLPTSNMSHKSGTFPFWSFVDNGGLPYISLGTDSVVSKSRLDVLTESYQTRLTHLYNRTVKFSDLFRMITVNGARVLGVDKKVGRILPGYQADLNFWKLKDRGFIPYDEKDPMTLIGNLITHHGRTVRDMMIKGKFIIKDRKHQLVDESKLLENLQKKHMIIRRRASKNK